MFLAGITFQLSFFSMKKTQKHKKKKNGEKKKNKKNSNLYIGQIQIFFF